tara:strand:+ start:1039 stop:2313 length:1275 start_codon:yes stop_codon:yes gene_type:complete
MKKEKIKITIIGQGYVGLPLAIEFGKKYNSVGFDINRKRIEELKIGEDTSFEVEKKDFTESKNLHFSSNLSDIEDSNIYIITVPTPINSQNKPDLHPLLRACKTVGKVLNIGDIVIFESTVYPGATEEECVPILESVSGLTLNIDFFVGYSPERVNPGDKNHRIKDIIKVTSGSTPEAAKKINNLYESIISAGTYQASSIKVAEAAKVIENTQRDVNIGLINELSLIFNKLEIDTEEVLKAAETKWNFFSFRPGLVGGHCIGIDPFYLTFKAQSVGYKPEIILAGRNLNDSMSAKVAKKLVDEMLKKTINIQNSKVLIFGITFKENCPDTRNTKVVDLILELSKFGIEVHCYDPLADSVEVKNNYGIKMIEKPLENSYDGIVLAVAHDAFKLLKQNEIRKYGLKKHILYDLKYLLPADSTDLRL